MTLVEARRQFEKRYLLEVLEEAGGNRKKAAKIAGINRTHLHRLLTRHQIGNRYEPKLRAVQANRFVL